MGEQAELRLDLDRAMQSVLKESWSDEVPDIIRHEDFRFVWPEERAALEQSLAEGRYSPRVPRLVEVPKSALATRPIAVLHLRDRIVYQALLDELGPHIDRELTEEVYSARLCKRKDGTWVLPKASVKEWVKFQDAGRALYEECELPCLLTTDITSYFEFIDIGQLVSDLRAIPEANERAVDLLARLLNGLSNATNLHGVPQGPEVSSLLGNLYLRPLDAVLRKLSLKFVRYQDDINVFAEGVHLLRRAVQELTPIVRARRLNLSSAKTKILTGTAVLSHFEDMRKSAINYRLEVGDPSVLGDIKDLFNEAVAGGEVNERDVKFAVFRLSKLQNDHAVPWVLDHLAEVPYLASVLVEYLSEHTMSHPEIERRVRMFLTDDSLNISSYVEMQLVRMWGRSQSLADESYDVLWQLLRNPAKESVVRQFAARAVGRHAAQSHREDLELLRNMFKLNTDDKPLRRALLVAIWEAGGAPRAWLADVSVSDPELERTCKYLRSNPKIPPP